VWLDGEGWTRVDPTAVVAPERLNRGLLDLLPQTGSLGERVVRNIAWLSQLRQRWDAINDWWNERVVRYDMRTQLDLLKWLGFDEPDWRILGYLLAAGLLSWLIVIAWHVGRSSRGTPADRLSRAYEKLCAKLARAGAPREPHEGPLAYALAVSARRPDIGADARDLLQTYADLRFGRRGEDASRPAAIIAFERAVARFRTVQTR
jgi:hypothetical protein